MNEDPRCCGSGTCIIDAEGRCWCGRQWIGQKIEPALPTQAKVPGLPAASQPPCPSAGSRS